MSEANQTVILGGFTLLDRIGKGGMGEVWRAERVGPGGVRRRAAVKRILSQFQNDTVLRNRFIAEAKISSRLEHPNVVQVIDFGDTPELFLVLEYVDGVSMGDLLKRGAGRPGYLTIPAAVYMIAEAASGLDYAHRRTDDAGQQLGIVHRDVSPTNVMVSTDGAVKVNDFGVARAADNIHRTQAGIALGKLPYMAPEQARGEFVDRRADVFALGICLWELLALRPLIPRGSPTAALEALNRCDFPPPSSKMPNVPAAIDEIVRAALVFDPSKRTSTAAELAKSLRTALSTLAPGFDGRDLARVVADLCPELHSAAFADPLSSAGSRPPDAPRSNAPPVPAAPSSGAVSVARPAAATVPSTAIASPRQSAATVQSPSVPAGAPGVARTIQLQDPAAAHVAPSAPVHAASSAPRQASATSSPFGAPAPSYGSQPQSAPSAPPNTAPGWGQMPPPQQHAPRVSMPNMMPATAPMPPAYGPPGAPMMMTPTGPVMTPGAMWNGSPVPTLGAPSGSGNVKLFVVAGVVVILALLAALVVIVTQTGSRSASPTTGATAGVAAPAAASGSAPASFEDYQIQQTRAALTGSVQRTAQVCAASNGDHGIAHVDLSFRPSGEATHVAVRVAGLSAAQDQAVTSCLETAFNYTRIAPLSRSIDVPDLSATF